MEAYRLIKMDKKLKTFIAITGSALILVCLYVPMVWQVCDEGGCFAARATYGFAWRAERMTINIEMLLIELGVIIIIASAYYFLILRRED